MAILLNFICSCQGYVVPEKKDACRGNTESMAGNVQIQANKGDVWALSAVKGKKDTYSIRAYSRKSGCLKFLAAAASCTEKYLQLDAKDDGSGRQQWVITPVKTPLSPPPPKPPRTPPPKPSSPPPSPLSPPPSPSPSPTPSPPPTLSPEINTVPGGDGVITDPHHQFLSLLLLLFLLLPLPLLLLLQRRPILPTTKADP